MVDVMGGRVFFFKKKKKKEKKNFRFLLSFIAAKVIDVLAKYFQIR